VKKVLTVGFELASSECQNTEFTQRASLPISRLLDGEAYAMARVTLTIVLVGFLTATATTQQGAALDVVSIRESPNTGVNFAPPEIEFQPGRVRIVDNTVEQLVAWAHGLNSPRVWDRLIVGWPDTGIKGRAFNITANLTTTEPLSLGEQRRIVLDLLAMRFGLKMHTESRPTNVFKLTMAKEGVLGPNLQRVDFNCFEMAPGDPDPKDKDGRSLCQRFGDIEQIIDWLNIMMADRVLINATGLKGYFVWNFGFGGGLSFETAIREQLGLRATPEVMPVDVVVIDNVQMPTPN
jgi:uncharacterized protein (TIGR03435 family)